MKFTKSTPETGLPDCTWFICQFNGLRQPMLFEKCRDYIDGVYQCWHVWYDMKGDCWLDTDHKIYFLNDLENEEFKNFDLAQ